MKSVRPIIGTLVASVALAGSAPAGNPSADQPDLGELWAAVKYCRAKHAKTGAERREYAEVIRSLRAQIRKLPDGERQDAFQSKKSIDASGTYRERKLDQQECTKLREAAAKSVKKPEPELAAEPEPTREEQ